MPRFISGLDLGQASDYSTLVVTRQSDTRPAKYDVLHLHRWKLGTKYTDIVSDLDGWFSTHLHGSTLVIDGTGVGRAVVDLIDAAQLKAKVEAYSITCGKNPGVGTVPKIDLVGAVQAALQTKRLEISGKLVLCETLTKELEMFRVKVTSDRNETFSAWRVRDHDDLVLALALAVWYGEKNAVSSAGYGHAPIPARPFEELPAGTFNGHGNLPAGSFG
ncbi:MAG TPA: hypothetical protein VGI99_02215 [Gemmataceae bacterium]|jgi:hypothetical protein